MKILSYREGFANNSSSTHSTLIYSDIPINLTDEDCDSFGWNWFIAQSREKKELYFLSQLTNFLITLFKTNNHDWDAELCMAEVIEKLKIIINKDINIEYSERFPLNETNNYNYFRYDLQLIKIQGESILGIDHQSLWVFPIRKQTKDIDYEFVSDFYNYLMQDTVIIRGGNDNESEEPFDDATDEERAECEILQNLFSRLNLVPNKESRIAQILNSAFDPTLISVKNGTVYTILNTASGNKVRLTFSDEFNDVKYDKSPHPELVDLNITDYCSENCRYCYRGCGISGKHATINDVIKYVDELSSLNVFEIAIGGGNILAHPNIGGIIKYIADQKMIPNITLNIYSVSNLLKKKQDNIINSFIDHCKSIALSVSRSSELRLYNTIKSYLLIKNPKLKITCQIIPEIFTKTNYDIFIQDINKFESITMLGYKNSPRGSFQECNSIGQDTYVNSQQFKNDLKNFILKLKEKNCDINCDTSFVQKFEDIIKEFNVPKILYYTVEGKFSCYVDAVKNTVSASSYSHEDYPYENSGDILKYYQTF